MPGNGVARATAIFGNFPLLQPFLVAPAVAPIVGTTPPNFINNPGAYQRSDFINLIIFYNEDFGIVQGDTIQDCIEKVHLFLTSY